MVKKNIKKYQVLKTLSLTFATIIIGLLSLNLYNTANPRLSNPGFNWSVIYFILFTVLGILLAIRHTKNLELDTTESGKHTLIKTRLLFGAPLILFPFVLAFFIPPINAGEFVHSFFGLTRAPGASISPQQITLLLLCLPLTIGWAAWLLYDDKINNPAAWLRLLLLIVIVPFLTFAALMLSFIRHYGN